MRAYDSILTIQNRDLEIYRPHGPWMVLDKLDGSNLRVEVHTKRGEFVKWGSRKVLLDPDNESNILSKAVSLFDANYDKDALLKFLRTYSQKSLFTLYFEFVGPQSFAGSHDLEDVHELRLLDIWEERRGYIPSKDLYKVFGAHMPTHILTLDRIDEDFVKSVQGGTLEGMGGEGVILKHPTTRIPNSRSHDRAKLKRLDWIAKVQEIHKQDWQKFI